MNKHEFDKYVKVIIRAIFKKQPQVRKLALEVDRDMVWEELSAKKEIINLSSAFTDDIAEPPVE